MMVFWIGTDIGVFIAGLRFLDPRLSIAERSAVIQVGMVVDRFPRICFVLIVPVGLQIAYLLGLMPMSSLLMVLVWLLSGIWLTAVIAGMRFSGSPRGRPWRLLEQGFQIASIAIFGALAIASFTGRMLIPGWLAAKLAIYAAICWFALLLDHSFAPVFVTFGLIASDGSTPAREAALKRHMIRTYVWVLAIYVAVLASGLLGTVR